MFLAIPLYDDNPMTRLPVVTVGLITLCVLVFLWQEGLGAQAADHMAYALGLVPAVLFGEARLPPELRLVPPWATIFTSMFLHGGWLHLIGNMIYLWLFGKGVESALGAGRFLVFYLLGGTAAAFAQAVIDPSAEVPMIGASGAIAGVLGAYLVLHPRANVVVLIWIFIFIRFVTVPALIVLGLWFLLQLFNAVSASSGEPGVAFWAHIGGFMCGVVLVPFFRRSGVAMLQPRRSAAFRVTGSVPSVGRPRRSLGPWD